MIEPIAMMLYKSNDGYIHDTKQKAEIRNHLLMIKDSIDSACLYSGSRQASLMGALEWLVIENKIAIHDVSTAQAFQDLIAACHKRLPDSSYEDDTIDAAIRAALNVIGGV